MKRALVLILATLMIVMTFAACGDENGKDAAESTESPAEPAIGADSPEDAFMQFTKYYTEHDPEAYLNVSYGVRFSKEKSFEEYKKDFLERYEYDADEEIPEYKIISTQEWPADITEKSIEKLSYLNNDTDKITKFVDVKYTVTRYGKEAESSATAIECDGRWFIIGE